MMRRHVLSGSDPWPCTSESPVRLGLGPPARPGSTRVERRPYRAGMARARTFEGPALVLGDVLYAHGHRDQAAALREVLSETDAVRDDVERALVAERLRQVVAADHVAAEGSALVSGEYSS